jgi:hypothetical protein
VFFAPIYKALKKYILSFKTSAQQIRIKPYNCKGIIVLLVAKIFLVIGRDLFSIITIAISLLQALSVNVKSL